MAASEHHRLSHMAEDRQSSEHESVNYGLDSVLFDVWDTNILPLLSIPDIFQLCGVNSDVSRLLFNEPTFKRLCQVSSIILRSTLRVFTKTWLE